MDFFPAQYSTLSAHALNERIRQSYGLHETTCKLLIHNVSDTYVVENSREKYVFKVYRDSHRKLGEIQGELQLLTQLREHGARVSYPVPASDGMLYQQFQAAEGIRYGALFSWAQGIVVPKLNEQQLSTVGREMALIHNITSTFELDYQRKSYSVQSTITDPLECLKPALAAYPDEYQYLKTTGGQVRLAIEQLDHTAFSYGYCHYDYFPKNFHFAEDGNVTFFDFDFAGKGALINDITSFFIHFFLEVTYGKITVEEAKKAFATFVKSYREVRPLRQEELDSIPLWGFTFWLFYLGFQYENFDDWSNYFWGPRFIRERVALIKKWVVTAATLLPPSADYR